MLDALVAIPIIAIAVLIPMVPLLLAASDAFGQNPCAHCWAPSYWCHGGRTRLDKFQHKAIRCRGIPRPLTMHCANTVSATKAPPLLATIAVGAVAATLTAGVGYSAVRNQRKVLRCVFVGMSPLSTTVVVKACRAAGADAAATRRGYHCLRKNELQARLRDRGLPVTGCKADLLIRLREADGDAEAEDGNAHGDVDVDRDGSNNIVGAGNTGEGDTTASGRGGERADRATKRGGGRAGGGEVNCGTIDKANLRKLRIPELRANLRLLKLPVSGPKAVLVERLLSERGFDIPRALSPPQVDLSGFSNLSDKLWLHGVVRAVLNVGAFVEVAPPEGPLQWGLVWPGEGAADSEGLVSGRHQSLVGQELLVRLACLDEQHGRLGFYARYPDAAPTNPLAAPKSG